MLASLRAKNIFKRVIKDNIVVIDSVLPNRDAVGPRNSDFLEFTRQLPAFRYYTMYPMKPGPKAWFAHGYGMEPKKFAQQLPEYVQKYPEAKGKIRLLSPNKKYTFNVAYTYFLAETYTMLPFLEKNRIPFVFLLNPGGAFGINNESSDAMLRTIFNSPFFRKVIVNQQLFKDYLLKKKLCKVDDIVYDFSGSAQFRQEDVRMKRFYKKEKQTFDMCFVAAKYSVKGVDKGYDLFIAAAKKLARKCPDMRFHVVGGFSAEDIDVSSLKDVIKFYGYVDASALPMFYASMDIYLSPNRPFKLYEGGSDGFPLSAGAMYCGVAGFNADELHMNTEFSSDEVVIVRTNVRDIVMKVQHAYEHPAELYKLARKGQRRAQSLFDIEKHIQGRIQLLKNVTGDNT